MSSQGAASPPLPNGCGRELNGLSLHRDQVTASVVRRRGANRTTKEGKASGRSDRHCHLPSASGEARGAYEIQEERGHVPEEVPIPIPATGRERSRNQRQRSQPICDVLLSIRGRRPSLPETNSMAGRACVRHVVLHTVSLSRKRAFAVSPFRQTTHEQVFTTLLRMSPP